ncbi:MAG: site-2 protease family protein [Deltaproteobacteria bacterium]|nr:site-2 protease family protein [Deltaproteobacteria bacterium]
MSAIPSPEPAPLAADEALFAAARAALDAPRPQTRPGIYLLLFLLFIGSQWEGLQSLAGIAVLVAVLLFHEAGHALGMRAFGFRDVRMFFIPFFGAAVTGRPRGASAWKDALVSLLGPAPGIVLGVALAVALQRFPLPPLQTVVELLLMVNVFNLLPFGGLDGGRFLQRVIFSRHRVLEALFLAGGSALVAAVGFSGDSVMLGVFGLLGLLTVPQRFRLRGRARALWRAHPTLSPDPPALGDEHARAVFQAARAPLPEPFRHNAQHIAQGMESLLDAGRPPPGALASVLLLALYGVTWIVAVAGVVLATVDRANPEWRVVQAPGWRAEMPAQPLEADTVAVTPAGERPCQVRRATITGLKRFTVAVVDAGGPVNAADWLALSRAEHQADMHMTVASQEAVVVSGVPGVRLVLRNSYRHAVLLQLVHGTRLYTVATSAPDADDPDGQRFLASFALTTAEGVP